MADTPEAKVKKKIRAVLNDYGAYYEQPMGSMYGAPCLDITGCYQGQFFAIEAKAPGKKPTPRQEVTIKLIDAAGGQTFVIDGEGGLVALRLWLDVLKSK